MGAVRSARGVSVLTMFLALAFFSGPALAIDFGDDASRWANDGECDDPRFSGPGMTKTLRLDADILHDATDCRQAHEAGRVALAEPSATDEAATPPSAGAQTDPQDSAAVDFGDDSSKWANDGECDDPRFAGAGMTTTNLLESDTRQDATDCRKKFEAGEITLKEGGGVVGEPDSAGATDDTTDQSAPLADNARQIDFGDDASRWANDGECDDPRFAGEGMTGTRLLEEDSGHDASDCRAAVDAGKLHLK